MATEMQQTATVSIEALLDRLSQAKRQLYGPQCRPLTMGKLRYHACDTQHRAYIDFRIPKKRPGEYRTISAPCPGLKCIQRCLNRVLSDAFQPPAAAMGFVPGRSVADNARVHVGQNYIYNIDLRNFFPSIRGSRVCKRLQAEPFLFDPAAAALVARLCTGVDERGEEVLPQGAPTSPVLSNIVCESLDRKLARLAQAYDLRYTRYADDLTFSGNTNKFAPEGAFCRALRHIVEHEEHFAINEAKTRVAGRHQRQEATGLTVNERCNVARSYVKQLRTMLHNWEQNGYAYAQARFEECYHPTRNAKGTHHIENIIGGKLAYMLMVKGPSDPVYMKLNARYQTLVKTI